MTAIDKLRALLDDHEQRYGRGDLWRAASEEMARLESWEAQEREAPPQSDAVQDFRRLWQSLTKPAALASPCCEGLRHQLAETTSRLDTANKQFASVCRTNMDVATELAAAKSEIARLTAERICERPDFLAGWDAAVEHIATCAICLGLDFTEPTDNPCVEDMVNAIVNPLRSERDGFAAELRQAVDALRDYKDEVSMTHEQWHERISKIVAAYDAKHGEKA